jgi:hypothetical protein
LLDSPRAIVYALRFQRKQRAELSMQQAHAAVAARNARYQIRWTGPASLSLVPQRSKDGEAPLPAGIFGGDVNIDLLAGDRLGTTAWSL